MIERPVFFNGEMIRAILQGHKTQTRRIMKTQPPEHWTPVNSLGDPDYTARTYTKEVIDRHGFLQAGPSVFGVADETWGAVSPSGMPGDRLWVRENWWQAGDSVQSYPGDDESVILSSPTQEMTSISGLDPAESFMLLTAHHQMNLTGIIRTGCQMVLSQRQILTASGKNALPFTCPAGHAVSC